MFRYIEFAVASNFSFLRGASHPEELMHQAASLGLDGIGLSDRNSVAGAVRPHIVKREHALTLAYHPGARLVFADGTPDILAYPRDRPAWGRLTRLLTRGNLRAEKGDCILMLDDLLDHIDGIELIVMERGTRDTPAPPQEKWKFISASDLTSRPTGRPRLRLVGAKKPPLLTTLRDAAPGRVRLAATMLHRGHDRRRLAQRAALAREAGVPLIAVNDVLYHHPDRRELQDVLTCIHEHLTIDAAGRRLAANAERYLKPASEMARLFREMPEAIEETLRLGERLTFNLNQLSPDYPDEVLDGFATAQEALEHLVWEGARQRYPNAIDASVRESIEHEFELIRSRRYAAYFLTVYDIVRFARSKGILCQGRGSAANSTVCYCMGITSVDPVRGGLLFERFLSTERDEPPDIDVDFEHERREEVIQYIYTKYSRDRAGIAATVISYRGRSAIREIGKVFGLSEDTIGALSSSIWGMGGGAVRESDVKRIGIDVTSPRMRKMAALTQEIQSTPRHLSQHVGGFVITNSRLDTVVPVMNGAMPDRTHIEWDKDDLDALNLLKVDVLGLGMLTCIRKAFELCEKHYGKNFRLPLPSKLNPGEVHGYDLATVPDGVEAEAVYNMLCRADSIGVFQVESRAQMSMLPRLRPREFYDLVIEVAIVRPGPIQGDMVHPYLRRREKFRATGEEPPYPSPSPQYGDKDELKSVLKKTLGVPLFQEQAMKIAIVAGGFTAAEADKLRRAMATFKRTGTIGTFRKRMIDGMTAKGYERDFAERCFSQIEGFGEYGFPESHAASFALLVYASAWLKCRYPDAFAAALLNAQPMGFYAPAQIVRDVREHGVEVRPIDVNHSDWDAVLEKGPRAAERLHKLHGEMVNDIRSENAIRLGMREIKGLSEDDAKRIVEKRHHSARPRESGDPEILETAEESWIPASAGMSGEKAGMSGEKRAPYTSVRDVWLRTGLSPRVLERLADADAFGSLGLTRRQALWAVKALGRVGDKNDDLPLFAAQHEPPPFMGEVASEASRRGKVFTDDTAQAATPQAPSLPSPASGGGKDEAGWGGTDEARGGSGFAEPIVHLPPMPLGEEVVNDYRFLHLSLRAHPAQFLRADLAGRGVMRNEDLHTHRSGERVTVSGLVTIRQRPGSAAGVVFMTIEDETAIANIIVWPNTFERFRPVILGARYVAISGRLQHEAGVIHVVADKLEDLTFLLARLAEGPAIESLARCDEVKRPVDEHRDSRGSGGRRSRLQALLAEMPELASDLDVPARGTAHAPTRRGGG